MDRPDVLPSEPEKRRGKRGWRVTGSARRRLEAKGSAGGPRAERGSLLYEPPGRSAAEVEKPRAYTHTPSGQVSAELTQLGAQLRLEMVCYAAGGLGGIDKEWSYLSAEKRFPVSLTWQYLVTGSLPALHRHYLLERMTREQCASYEAFLKDLRRSKYLIERLGFFPPWRTLESVTAEAVLEHEIPGKLARHSKVSRPAGRHPDGRRKWRKRMTDRLTGVPRKGS